jgi:hypothetical protein
VSLPDKLLYYTELAEQRARQVTGTLDEWAAFLTTAGRLYKYPFDEQLLIYAQRPDAAACAPIETWNKPMNRYVRRGSKGIALIDHSADKPRIRYVFDYADTVDGRANARHPYFWEMKPEHERVISKSLDRAFGLASARNDDKGDVILGLAHELAARYIEDNSRDIGYAGGETEDDFAVSAEFRDVLTVSAAYSIMTRCGIDTAGYFKVEDFLPLRDIGTIGTVYALGQAVSTVTGEVLRTIEAAVRNYEREDIHDRKVDPSRDNMLLITSDGRKIGLDQRLMNPLLPDDEKSKVNACMENIFRIWEETAEKRLTQLCFCDFSTPNTDGRFNVYDDIKAKLIARGIPENEIAFIHDANTEIQKKELFAKVRSGNVRVLFGSTFKCGAGTNIQDRLVALHDLDCPWRPADLAQRAGRIVRQGNLNPEVDIYRYVTNSTFDSYLFQTIEKKQEFISQIMTSKSPVRSCDDVDEDALSYAEIKALCAGNPLIKEKMQLDIEVAKLKLLRADHQSQQYRLQDNLLTAFPKRIESAKAFIAAFNSDISRLETHTHKTEEGISPMTLGGRVYTERSDAGAALMEACKGITTTEQTCIGSYRGFDMFVSFDSFNKEFHIALKGEMTHTAVLGDDASGNITRINNAFDRIPQRLQSVQAELQTVHDQIENAKIELDKPFAFETEFAEKTARLAELDAMLNLDEPSEPVLFPDDAEIAGTAAKSPNEKPSILEALRQGAEKSRAMFGDKPKPVRKPEISI